MISFKVEGVSMKNNSKHSHHYLSQPKADMED